MNRLSKFVLWSKRVGRKLWCYRLFRALLTGVALLLFAQLVDYLFPLNLPEQGNNFYARLVVDRDGLPLRAFPDKRGVWRYEVKLEDVSPLYLQALLSYEDKRFWYHPGIDPLALLRALSLNIKNQRVVSGGSTLSMQVARLLHPHSRSLSGKFYQLLRTLQLEWHLSKKEILTLYCNIAPFGGTIEGVQAASYTYLNKSASQLTHAEAALLAVLPQAPTRLRPDLQAERALAARNKVLDRMQKREVWQKTIVEQAKLETVYAYRNTPDIHAPLLARRLIQAKPNSNEVIQTTINGELQRALEDYARQYVELQEEKTSAAILVVENSSAETLAYVGTASFGHKARFGHVDMVKAIRSPGSTLKPFLYALALDQGLIHSESLLADIPQSWQDYRPGNFSGSFSGPVSVSDALQRSLNVPAVALMDKFGPEKFAGRLGNAGIDLVIPAQQANLSLILGGTGISLEKLVSGFMAFANQGQTQQILFSKDQTREPPRYLMSSQAAWVVQNILSDVQRPGAVRQLAALQKHNQLAWKTGTSYGDRDTWAIGVDKKYTIGVWLGRPDGTPSPGSSGRSSAGPLLHAVADFLGDARQAIPKPEKMSQQTICWPLGKLQSETEPEHCHLKRKAWLINENVPPTCSDNNNSQQNPFIFFVDSKSGKRVHGNCTVYGARQQQSAALWPAQLEPWLPTQWRRSRLLPGFSENCQQAVAGGQKLQITGIEPGTVYKSPVNNPRAPEIDLIAVGGEGIHLWYVNGRFHHRAAPLAVAKLVLKKKGRHQILVLDEMGEVDLLEVFFE